MWNEARLLFLSPSRSREHRVRQQAAATFIALWCLSVVLTTTTSFLLISVQSLVLLNTAVSLAASVVTRSLCSRTGSQDSTPYPFTFGFYRLSTVIRFGGIVFLVFGCLATGVESLHRGMHEHHSNPYYLLYIGAVQLVFQILFRREVRLTDRVTGHHGMAGVQSEDILHQSCVTASQDAAQGNVVGGGDIFQTRSDMKGGATPPISASTSPTGVFSGSSRNVSNKTTSFVTYLLCPLTCVVTSMLILITDWAFVDTVAALILAVYYGYTGYAEGKVMLDLLMNKCVIDVRRNRNLERCLRNVKMLDGVLQIQSTLWWNMNVADSMLMVRIRLMSGVDACAVSHSVRRQLLELATNVFVECFPANGTDGSLLDGNAQLSWCSTATAHAGHGHNHEHGCDHGHSHNHEHSHGEDDEHGHGKEDFGFDRQRLSSIAVTAESRPDLSAGSNGYSSNAQLIGTATMASGDLCESPYSTLMAPAHVSPAVHATYPNNGPTTPGMAFPAPPVSASSLSTAPLNARGAARGNGAPSVTIPAFPAGLHSPYGQPSSNLSGSRAQFGGPMQSGAVSPNSSLVLHGAGPAGAFPSPPSTSSPVAARQAEMPPPVFTPFRDQQTRPSRGADQEFV